MAFKDTDVAQSWSIKASAVLFHPSFCPQYMFRFHKFITYTPHSCIFYSHYAEWEDICARVHLPHSLSSSSIKYSCSLFVTDAFVVTTHSPESKKRLLYQSSNYSCSLQQLFLAPTFHSSAEVTFATRLVISLVFHTLKIRIVFLLKRKKGQL